MSPLLSLAIIVKNEAHNLHQLLYPIYDLLDEIVACDTGSSDDTVEVLGLYNAHVVYRPWDNDFSAARNAAIEHCTSRWIIWLDADDRVTHDDMAMLRLILEASDPAESIYMTLLNEADKKEDLGMCKQLRVFPNIGVRFEGRLHEQVVGSLKRIIGPTVDRHLLSYPVNVLHTGYTNEETMKRKWVRNLAMLLDDIEEGPNPPNMHAIYHLGQTLEGMGLVVSAYPFYLWLMQHSSEDSVAKFLIARAATSAAQAGMGFMQHWFREVVAILEDNDKKFPNDDLTQILLSQVRLRQGRYQDAIAITDRVLERGLNVGILPYSKEKAMMSLMEVRKIAQSQTSRSRATQAA